MVRSWWVGGAPERVAQAVVPCNAHAVPDDSWRHNPLRTSHFHRHSRPTPHARCFVVHDVSCSTCTNVRAPLPWRSRRGQVQCRRSRPRLRRTRSCAGSSKASPRAGTSSRPGPGSSVSEPTTAAARWWELAGGGILAKGVAGEVPLEHRAYTLRGAAGGSVRARRRREHAARRRARVAAAARPRRRTGPLRLAGQPVRAAERHRTRGHPRERQGLGAGRRRGAPGGEVDDARFEAEGPRAARAS